MPKTYHKKVKKYATQPPRCPHPQHAATFDLKLCHSGHGFRDQSPQIQALWEQRTGPLDEATISGLRRCNEHGVLGMCIMGRLLIHIPYWGVTLCQPTPREVDSMLVHATPREVNPRSYSLIQICRGTPAPSQTLGKTKFPHLSPRATAKLQVS